MPDKCGLFDNKHRASINTGRFIMFSVITNLYNKKTKGPTLMKFFTATRKLKRFFSSKEKKTFSVFLWL